MLDVNDQEMMVLFGGSEFGEVDKIWCVKGSGR